MTEVSILELVRSLLNQSKETGASFTIRWEAKKVKQEECLDVWEIFPVITWHV